MSIADKLTAVAENVSKVFAAGKVAKQAEVDSEIYIGSFYGNGEMTQTVEIPFEPDTVCVFCYDDTVFNAATKTVMLYHVDLAAVGTIGSYYIGYQGGVGTAAGSTVASTLTRCTYSDGVLTMTPREKDGAIFSSDSKYTIIATVQKG